MPTTDLAALAQRVMDHIDAELALCDFTLPDDGTYIKHTRSVCLASLRALRGEVESWAAIVSCGLYEISTLADQRLRAIARELGVE